MSLKWNGLKQINWGEAIDFTYTSIAQPPEITIVSVTANKISAKTGKDASTVQFTSNKTAVDFIARAGGYSDFTGDLVGRANKLLPKAGLKPKVGLKPTKFKKTAGDVMEFVVENEELTSGDATYKINVYTKDFTDQWTAYQSG